MARKPVFGTLTYGSERLFKKRRRKKALKFCLISLQPSFQRYSRASISINKENNEVLQRDLILLTRNRAVSWNKVKFKTNAPCYSASDNPLHGAICGTVLGAPHCTMGQAQLPLNTQTSKATSKYTNTNHPLLSSFSCNAPSFWPLRQVAQLVHR